ncbi:MAG TPA: hypothetical protein VK395_07315 [Gemmataceae bacterium]|nr:hypothetical protein [Gemmataceae bacterium]
MQSIVLAKGVLKAMLVSKLKTGSAFFLIASMVVATSYYTLAETQAEVKPDKPRVAHSNPDKGKEEKPATPTPYVLEFNPDKGKIEPRLLPPNAVNPAQKPHYQPILITTFYQPIVEGGALGDPMPFQLEISGQPPELLGALLKRMLDAIQPGNLKREKLSAEEKLDKILERLDRLEHQLESTKTKQP